jgi:tetratricopeptide (TPR) repeat protein
VRNDLENALAGSYTIECELGRGGMATVWLGRDLRHDRPVAIKVLHPELAGAIGVDRFVREVRLTARIQHPNIVPVHDSGVVRTADGSSLPWYTMSHIAGESLRSRMTREKQLPVDEALRIGDAIASALQAAHAQGIVHRDIKPENVLLADDRIYVVDFGIARALEPHSERLTSTGFAVGTPGYMSPEQSLGSTVDARSDQYSLAALIYEMLAGEPPFTGPTAQVIMARRLAERARPLRVVRPTLPEPTERALLKALERTPADRFADVASFATELHRASGASPAVPRRLTARRRILLAAALLMVFVAGGWPILGRRFGTGRGARDPEVVALFERGMREYGKRTPAGLVAAIAAFSAAVARDSSYVAARTGLARAYVQAYARSFGIPGVPRESIVRLAVAAVDGALAADSGNAAVWEAHSLVSRMVDPTDVSPAIRSARRALELDSARASAWQALALSLVDSGNLSSAITAWHRAAAANPTYTEALGFLAQGYYWHSQYDSAAVWADSAIALDPTYLLGRTMAGYVAIERGDPARAIAAFEAAERLTSDVEVVNARAGRALAEAVAGRRTEALAILRASEADAATYHQSTHTAVFMAEAYAAAGQNDQALAWLTRVRPRAHLYFQLHMRCDPPMDRLKRDDRFRALLTRPAPSPGRGC